MNDSELILKNPEVRAMVKMSRSAIYLARKRGEFPRPVLLGKRAVGWRRSDLLAWIKSRAAA